MLADGLSKSQGKNQEWPLSKEAAAIQQDASSKTVTPIAPTISVVPKVAMIKNTQSIIAMFIRVRLPFSRTFFTLVLPFNTIACFGSLFAVAVDVSR
ncbi:MAG: hypothetical protein ACK421_11535 [Pseudanabaenaceae cyanobacterium]